MLSRSSRSLLKFVLPGKVFLEFYTVPGYNNNMLLVVLFTIKTFTDYYTVLYFQKKLFHGKLLDLVLFYT